MSVNSKTLSAAKRRLLQLLNQADHGTMLNLVVLRGEPVLDPAPKIKLAFKLGGKRIAPRAIPSDFELKDQHVELFELMEAKQNGTISKLTIQFGLPVFAEWEDN